MIVPPGVTPIYLTMGPYLIAAGTPARIHLAIRATRRVVHQATGFVIDDSTPDTYGITRLPDGSVLAMVVPVDTPGFINPDGTPAEPWGYELTGSLIYRSVASPIGPRTVGPLVSDGPVYDVDLVDQVDPPVDPPASALTPDPVQAGYYLPGVLAFDNDHPGYYLPGALTPDPANTGFYLIGA